jgi:hypothetical protein
MNSEYLNQWRQKGDVYLWRYTHGSKSRCPGLNVHGDQVAIQSLIALVKCLADTASGTRTVRLCEPTRAALSISGCNADYEWFRKVRLNYDKQFDGIVFSIEGEGLVLTTGYAGTLKLKEALGRYEKGACDFALSCDVRGGGKYVDKSPWQPKRYRLKPSVTVSG